MHGPLTVLLPPRAVSLCRDAAGETPTDALLFFLPCLEQYVGRWGAYSDGGMLATMCGAAGNIMSDGVRGIFSFCCFMFGVLVLLCS